MHKLFQVAIARSDEPMYLSCINGMAQSTWKLLFVVFFPSKMFLCQPFMEQKVGTLGLLLKLHLARVCFVCVCVIFVVLYSDAIAKCLCRFHGLFHSCSSLMRLCDFQLGIMCPWNYYLPFCTIIRAVHFRQLSGIHRASVGFTQNPNLKQTYCRTAERTIEASLIFWVCCLF